MVSVLANLSIAMCHVFVKDKVEMPPQINIFSNSSEDENPKANIFISDSFNFNFQFQIHSFQIHAIFKT